MKTIILLLMTTSLITPSTSPHLSDDDIDQIRPVTHQPEVTIEHNLVNLTTLYSPPLQEIRYATTYNFTGEKLYPFPAAWLHRDTAAALEKVQAELARQGLGLKIYDAYRPICIQQKMWDHIQDSRYVADPSDPESRGRHTHGTAVDVTLVDKLGRELPMPTDLDDFSEKAHIAYDGGTEEQIHNRQRLQEVMSKYGFIPYPYEWWHFDLSGWEKYPVLNISFEDLANGKTTTTPVVRWPQ